MVSPAPSVDPLFPPSTIDQIPPSTPHPHSHHFRWPASVHCPTEPDSSPYPHVYSVGARPLDIESTSATFSPTNYINNVTSSNSAIFAYNSEPFYQPASSRQPHSVPPATSSFDANHHLGILESPTQSRSDLIDHATVPSSSAGQPVQLPGFTSPESAFYQYQNRMEGQLCQICGELAAGFHHGAYVCEACKKFFMRHSMCNGKSTTACPSGGSCVIAKTSRGRCQQCRYKKCIEMGMSLRDFDGQGDVDISNIPCRVCGGRSSGFHFGALTCEGCKGFFRRTEEAATRLICVGGKDDCTITPRSRNACKACRFGRCIRAGMSKRGSRIGRQPNAVKFHCAIEIRQLKKTAIDSTVGSSNSDHRKLPRLDKDWLSSETGASSDHCSSTQSTVSDQSRRNSFADVIYDFPLSVSGVCGSIGVGGGLSEKEMLRRGQTRRKYIAPMKIESYQSSSTPSSSSSAVTSIVGVGVGLDEVDAKGDAGRGNRGRLEQITTMHLENTNCLGPIPNADVPLTEGVSWFNYGMRTATEFLRLPNTYFKSRFEMSSITPNHADNIHQVWNHVMNHFHMHSQQIVQFAKLIPGFNQLGLTARGSLVREGMYSIMMLLMARDYEPDTGKYNYFDFSTSERVIILHHFPSFNRLTEHLSVSGRFFHQLGLTLPEIALVYAIEIIKNFAVLNDPPYTDAKKIYILAKHSLLACMQSQFSSQEVIDHRWAQLENLSEMLHNMSKEHHGIAIQLRATRQDLQFPDLYLEMFQLTDSTTTMVSVAATAAAVSAAAALMNVPTMTPNLQQLQDTLQLCHTTSSSTTTDSPANWPMVGATAGGSDLQIIKTEERELGWRWSQDAVGEYFNPTDVSHQHKH